MSIDALNTIKAESNKQVFLLKPIRKAGLVVQVHHTLQTNQKQQTFRFLHASFNKVGGILAAGNQNGNIFFIDFVHNKFWGLPTVIPLCSVLKFSHYSDSDIVVGTTDGKVFIVNTENGEVTGELISHQQAITQISFSEGYFCLTSSKCEAVLWDLRSNTKAQVLSIQPDCILKHVLFMPVTNNILACFEDDTVLIWKYETFEVFKQILPASWNKHQLKSVAFTRNGRAMVFSGYSPHLAVFMLDTWTITKIITLPDCIQVVKKIDFLPQLFDGGCNRILGILSSSGIMYFYDMEQEIIVNKIILEQEIIRFDCSADGKHLACILKLGEINIYKVGHYIPLGRCIEINQPNIKDNKSSILRVRKSSSRLATIQKQIKEVLDVDKLRVILKEFGQYPDSYRLKIWIQLLELPNNYQQYNVFINKLSRSSFENLENEYPLENKIALKNLRKLLCNLVTWCPFFAQVAYLPVFVFPFVKVFQNEPVLCFEAVCTIIVNWCQHWYEYFPLPPVNILAMVENLILEHDSQLLKHFQKFKITSKVYAWTLLEVAFSEVLTVTDWSIFWDHILTNEPAFFLTCTAAYSILNRQTLFAMSTQNEFEVFYHNQNNIDMKRLLAKSYALLNNTKQKTHPRQYINPFKPLESGSYPQFFGFPKTLIDFEFKEMDNLKKEKQALQQDEEQLLKSRLSERQKMEKLERDEEEDNRLKELEKVCREKINNEREHVKQQRKKLVNLRKQIHQEEEDILKKSREKVIEKNAKERQRTLEKIISEVEQNRAAEEMEVMKAESNLVKHYSELLRHKIHLEEAVNLEQPIPTTSTEHRVLKKQQKRLAEELEMIQKDVASKSHLKHLNIATGIAAMDNLIMKIEVELAQQAADSYGNFIKDNSNVKILRLQAETKELELEVSKLLHLLADMKTQETKEKLTELRSNISNKKELSRYPDNHILRHQTSHSFKDKVSTMSSFGNDFKKLRKLIGETRVEYTAHPPSLDIEYPEVRN